MASTVTCPVAISRISEDDTREAQNLRAFRWLAEQDGGPVIVVTPQKDFDGDSLKHLVKRPGVSQHTWRGFSIDSLRGRRVVYCWPDRQHLNDLWDVDADALVVVEHGGDEAEEWIEDANRSSFSRMRPFSLASTRKRPERSAAQRRRGHLGVRRAHGRWVLVRPQVERGGHA